MTIQLWPVDRIDFNPFPARPLDPVHVAGLKAGMKARGFEGALVGRLNPADPTRVQIGGGGHRLAGLRELTVEDPARFAQVPVDLRELTDRDLEDDAIIENAFRLDPSPIETARAIERYRARHSEATNATIAEVFHLQSGASLSNKVRLLEHSRHVQHLVHTRQLAERNARALLVVARLAPDAVDHLADEALSADNPEEFIDGHIEDLLEKKGRDLERAPWKLDWPKTLLTLTPPRGALTPLPPCTGCPALFRRGDTQHHNLSIQCGRAECYDAKLELAAQAEAERISKKLKIPLATADEKTRSVYDGTEKELSYDYRRLGRIDQLVQRHSPELRLVVCLKNDGHYDRERHLGSRYAALTTTDPVATDQFLKAASAEERKEVVKAQRAQETDAERTKRVAQEERELAARRAERATFLRQKYDVLWLLTRTAHLIAERIALGGAFVQFVESVFVHRYNVPTDQAQLRACEDDLIKRAKNAKGAEAELLRKERLVLSVLANQIIGYQKPEEAFRFTPACREIEKMLGDKPSGDSWERQIERFGVKLPASWNRPPIHRTAFNCHQCGVFGSHEGSITKGEITQGWVVTLDGSQVTAVACPDCAPKSLVTAKAKAKK